MSLHLPSKTLFIHVPRTGGVSIGTALRNDGKRYSPNHKNYLGMVAKLESLGHDPAEWRSFAVVRNPWDRLTSFYYRRKTHYSLKKQAKLHGLEFNEWLTAILIDKEKYIARHSFLPQFDLVVGPDGKIGVDHLGRFEDLAVTWQWVQERTGVTADLPRLQPSRHRPLDWREVFDANGKKAIEEFYAKDIDAFGFTYDDYEHYPDHLKVPAEPDPWDEEARARRERREERALSRGGKKRRRRGRKKSKDPLAKSQVEKDKLNASLPPETPDPDIVVE